MNSFDSITLRAPQQYVDNAPPITPLYGYNNVRSGFFYAQQIPNTMPNSPRMITTLNQNYIGRRMLFPEKQNYDEAYQPTLLNKSVPLEQVPLRNTRSIREPIFSKY